MDHISIIKKALSTTLRYRALWILGFLWALVGGGSTGGNYFSGPGRSSNWHDGGKSFPNMNFNPASWLPWIILACGLLLVLGIAFTIVRYVLQAGIYRSLQQLSREGQSPTVRAAFRAGWHRRTWRLFLQNLVITLPLAVFAILLLAMAASPLILLTAHSDWVKGVGVFSAIGLIVGWIFLILVVAMAITILEQFWWRAAVLDDRPTFAAIRRGWQLVRNHLKDVLIMWLLMLGVGILFTLLLIPLLLVLAALVAAVAGLPGYFIYQSTHSWLPTLLWALPTTIILLILPLTFIQGLYLIFKTEVWNQVYAYVTTSETPLPAAEV